MPYGGGEGGSGRERRGEYRERTIRSFCLSFSPICTFTTNPPPLLTIPLIKKKKAVARKETLEEKEKEKENENEKDETEDRKENE